MILTRPSKVRLLKFQENMDDTVFDNIPEGTYALSIFHDNQNTGKLRTNAFGIPRDGFGFSNDTMGTFGHQVLRKQHLKLPQVKIM